MPSSCKSGCTYDVFKAANSLWPFLKVKLICFNNVLIMTAVSVVCPSLTKWVPFISVEISSLCHQVVILHNVVLS